MIRRRGIILILAAMLCLSMAFMSQAAGREKPEAFPFVLEMDLEQCDRLCYAGHPGSTVQYRDGLAATPDTSFRLTGVSGSGADVSHLSIDIAIIYENEDQSGSYREIVKSYGPGDLNLTDSYVLFSDNAIKSLADRGKLYSDSLKGVELTMHYEFRDSKKKTMYLYICSEDDYMDYLDRMYEEEE
ncbi:MAG: hypothetical protein IKE56_03335 [Lachnospiraceae bacterium]|nr:hypothetical protein [Lachnospiraceae bacterium]MBR2531684.1 hypothetical protein [Lachnospiraceae bacterium]